MLYKVIEDSNSCSVQEINSKKTIKGGMSKLDAKALSRHLNLGGAFDGKTPDFFFNTIKQFENK